MTDHAQEGQGSAQHGRILCWIARVFSLPVAIFGVLWMMYLPTTWGGSDSVPWMLPLDLLPLIFALIAWKWHGIGGALLSGSGILLVVVGILARSTEGSHDFLFLTPIGGVLLAGGLLHSAAWMKERRTALVPASASAQVNPKG